MAIGADGPYVLGSGTLRGRSEPAEILWDGDRASTLPASLQFSDSEGPNASGVLVGRQADTPIVWARGTTWELPVLSAAVIPVSHALDISDTGVVYGVGYDSQGVRRPVSWTCS
jgi:hypothetical protein